MHTVRRRQKRWLGHTRHDSLLRITLEGQIQERKVYGRRTMLLDWLLKTEEGNISYEELTMFAQDRSIWSQSCVCQNLPYGRTLHIYSRKGKGKGLGTCYSATCMSQTRDQQRFTISEVAADWHEPMVPQRIMWPSIARANGQLDPRCS